MNQVDFDQQQQDKRAKQRDLRVLRTLMRHGPQNEGKLAARCHQGIFMDSWKDCIQRLTLAGLVVTRHTGYGHSRLLDLTEVGMAKASESKAKKNEQAAKEILATVATE